MWAPGFTRETWWHVYLMSPLGTSCCGGRVGTRLNPATGSPSRLSDSDVMEQGYVGASGLGKSLWILTCSHGSQRLAVMILRVGCLGPHCLATCWKHTLWSST